MDDSVVIFGCGPVGKATAERLLAEGRDVVVAQRREPVALPKGATFLACDVFDRDAVVAAARKGEQFVVAIGLAYDGALWLRDWPRAMRHFVAATEATGARMTFVDNLYMYGPQTAPLVETMPLSDFGRKPAARSVATRVWMDACAAGRARVAALRAPDFYGPGVSLGYLGDPTIGRMAKGQRAIVFGSPDLPHDYAYVPDVARAVTSLLAAPDSAFGQAWHAPCAPTRTTRELLRIAADALDRGPARLFALPEFAIGALGAMVPLLRERSEMRFTFDRPYQVDGSKFAKAFWSDPTPFEEGIRATVHALSAASREARTLEQPRAERFVRTS